jgi:hypothetical protein
MPTSYSKKAKSTQQRRLNQKWYNDKEIDPLDLEGRFIENYDLFLKLDAIIRQKIEAVQRVRRDKSAYDKPAFSEFQADCNGYERALEEVRNYLKITKET